MKSGGMVANCALTLILLAVSFWWISFSHPKIPEGYRFKDFIAYYVGGKTFAASMNPYDVDVLRGQKTALGMEENQDERTCHYPPWFYLITQPIFHGQDYDSAWWRWFFISLVAVVLGGGLVWKSFAPNDFNPLAAASLALFFLPLLDVLLEGQLGGLLFLALCITLYFIVHERGAFAALSASFLTLKTHLFFPLIIVLFWYWFQRKEYRPILLFFISIAVGILASEISFPGISSFWITSLKEPQTFRQTASLASMGTMLMQQATGSAGKWMYLLFPALGIAVSLSWCSRNLRGQVTPKNLLNVWAPLVCISLLCAPYVWVSDFIILDTVPLALAALSFKTPDRKGEALLLLLGTQFVTLFFTKLFIQHSLSLFFFPIIMLGMWYAGKFRLLPRS